jgi:hypothetical protein
VGAVDRVPVYQQCTVSLSAPPTLSSLAYLVSKPSIQPRSSRRSATAATVPSIPARQRPRQALTPAIQCVAKTHAKLPEARTRAFLNSTPRFVACLSAHQHEFACTVYSLCQSTTGSPSFLSCTTPLKSLVCKTETGQRGKGERESRPGRRPIPPPSCTLSRRGSPTFTQGAEFQSQGGGQRPASVLPLTPRPLKPGGIGKQKGVSNAV